jgi:hypothetical protein
MDGVWIAPVTALVMMTLRVDAMARSSCVLGGGSDPPSLMRRISTDPAPHSRSMSAVNSRGNTEYPKYTCRLPKDGRGP